MNEPYFMRYPGKIINKRRSLRFMTGATAFFIFFTGALSGFVYRDLRQGEISKVEIMKKAVDDAGKEATRRAKIMLDASKKGEE
jgi:hypothetical protein